MKHFRTVAIGFALVLLTTVGWSGAGWAQVKVARIGVLANPSTHEATVRYYESFRQALAKQGWVEGKNVSLEYRATGGDMARLAEAAKELVQLEVDLIYADSAPAVRAAYAATRTIPIVAIDYTNDPVAAGYAQSYSRPGRNVTGVFLDAPQFAVKWLELLNAVVPDLSRVAVIWDPSPGATHLKAVQGAAQRFGVELEVVKVRRAADIRAAFDSFRRQPQALVILPSPMVYAESARLAKLTVRNRLLATSMAIAFAEAGGVLAYGPDGNEAFERCAMTIAKILAGAKPGDLPVERPTRFVLSVNLKTAGAFGLTIPESVLLRADRVIR